MNHNGELPPSGYTGYGAPPPAPAGYHPQNVAPRPPYPSNPYQVQQQPVGQPLYLSQHQPPAAYAPQPKMMPPPGYGTPHPQSPPPGGQSVLPPQFYNPVTIYMDPNVPQIVGPPPPAEPPRIAAIQVSIPKTEICQSDGKPFVEFHVEFKVGQSVFCAHKRYSDLLQIHECLVKHCRLAHLPEFPPKRWFADMTNPANREERARELLQYFTQLITNPEVLTDAEFHSMFGMDKHFADQIRSVGDHMIALKAQEQERRELERRYEAERNAAEARHAQDFHRAPPIPVPLSPGLVYFAPPVLRLNHPVCLQWKESKWQHGDAQITGPGQHPWLQVTHANCAHWHVAHDKAYSIANMRGDRLIYLEEAFKPGSIKYRIFRMLNTSMGAPPLMQKMCSIRRTPSAHYVVKLGGQKRCRSTTMVRCEGNWSDSDFKFFVQGTSGVAATVTKKMFASTDTYHIEVAAQQDILFFVAMATCIDRMHHHCHGGHSHGGGGGGSNVGNTFAAAAVGAVVGAAIVSSVSHHGGHHHHHHGHHGHHGGGGFGHGGHHGHH